MTEDIFNPKVFSSTLFEKMKSINPAIKDLELYEFRYGLNNLIPEGGWDTVKLDSMVDIEKRVNERAFYNSIKIKPKVDERIVLDENILRLTRMLLVGMVTEKYPDAWVNKHFYFDIRGFYFLHRTIYFTDKVLAHFGGKPFGQFEQKQKNFERLPEVGYKAFKEANEEVDQLFIESVMKLIAARGTPILLAIAGPTAAGKTEIVERLQE
ncbi:MAG TPA: hypothetical protein VII97_14455, partial [Anaerolineales bacterium]